MTQTEAFLTTLALEAPIAVAVVAARAGSRAHPAAVFLAALAASAITHPLLWLADPALHGALGLPLRWALLETAIALVEAVVYRLVARVGWGTALVVSLAANAVSLGVGIALYALGG